MRTPYIIGLTGKLESSYNAGASLDPTADGIMLAEPAELSFGRAFSGERAAPPGTLGKQRRVPPIGATASATLKVEPKGTLAAYSSSVMPPAHVLRRLAGWTYALTTTSGSEKYVGTPTPDPASAASGALSLYEYGMVYPLQGVLGDWTLGADGPGIPVEEFAIQGLLGAVDDIVVPPSLAYAYEAVNPPVSAGSGLFTLGNLTGAVLRKWQIKASRTIGAVLNQNAGSGHAGFRAGKRSFMLDVTFEMPALASSPFHATATIDPKRLFEAATELAWAIQIGSVQYNRRKLSGPKAQIAEDPKFSTENETVVCQLSLQLNPSALGQNDEVSDTWD